jgi:hypothetical protein
MIDAGIVGMVIAIICLLILLGIINEVKRSL